jgi:hypothetical protein
MTQQDVIRSRQPLTADDLRSHLIKIESGYGENKKKSDYLPMQGRILWFHGENSRYTIETEPLTIDFNQEIEGEKWEGPSNARKKVPVTVKGVAVFKAVVTIYAESGEVIIRTSGTKMESRLDFPDYVEKSETGAIGRALAIAGYGTKFALELHEGERIVDSPVELHSDTQNNNGHKNTSSNGKAPSAQSGTHIKPSEVDALKTQWAHAYRITSDIDGRWEKYKVYLFDRAIADMDLTAQHVAKIKQDSDNQKSKPVATGAGK